MKKHKITQTKPLLLPLRFTEMFQTSQVSYNFIYLFLQIHQQNATKKEALEFPLRWNTLPLLRQALLLDDCHIKATATGLAHNYATLGTEPEKRSSSMFHNSGKLEVVSSPPPLLSLFSPGRKGLFSVVTQDRFKEPKNHNRLILKYMKAFKLIHYFKS